MVSTLNPRKVIDAVTEEERCALTELLTDQCAHCRQGTRRPRLVTDLFDTPGGDHEIAYTFTARWPGHCDGCTESFEAGAVISRTHDGDNLCGDCAEGSA